MYRLPRFYTSRSIKGLSVFWIATKDGACHIFTKRYQEILADSRQSTSGGRCQSKHAVKTWNILEVSALDY